MVQGDTSCVLECVCALCVVTGHSAGYVLVLVVSDISPSDSCTAGCSYRGSGPGWVFFDQ